ncbi:hypothetical protein C8A01DRAFT_49254 [Parachaetomium inaequale]|uniref:Protein kinase domain-containing protein n=1 Tax=Parachaetomium inaequale TaxID=2588326 RepID=A0AAN6SP07_9PEZI|nr:hypothetical protein C8A01DRAFT_49254 [Parachaetomium inaequale]
MAILNQVSRRKRATALKDSRAGTSDEIEGEGALQSLAQPQQYKGTPNIASYHNRTAIVKFLPFMLASLDTRLQRNQRREKHKVLQVLRIEDRHLIERWAAELCAALDHLKLTDFDCVARIGDASYSNAPPWARLYPDPLTGKGRWGLYGPKTEQFAIGSLLYCMTRGHEPYGHPEEDNPELDVVRLFKEGVFPRVNAEGDVLDCIIDRCWAGWYESIKDLAEAAAQLLAAVDMSAATTFSTEYCAQKRNKCCRLIQKGLLEMYGV